MKVISRRFIVLFLLVILIFTAIWASSKNFIYESKNSLSQQQNAKCRMVQHIKGETCIPLNPQRIVTLDFNSFASVLALDIKPIATWITSEIEDDFSYFQGKADGVEILRSSSGQINLEKLLLLNPDLIIVASQPFLKGVYQNLSQIAPTVVLPWIETRGNWKQHIKDTARVFEKTETAIQIMGEYNQRVNQLKQLIGNNKAIRISFAFVASGQLVITRKKSFAGEILDDIGVLNPIFAESGDYDLSISEELLPKIDSDILFIAPLKKDDNSVIKRLQEKPIWSKLKAVQQNQVYLVDFSVWRGLNILAAYEMLNDINKYLVNQDVQPIGYAEIFSNRRGDFDRPQEQIPYLGDRITQPIANLGMSSNPSLETIIRLKPDLILGDIRGNQQQYSQLSQIAPTLLFEYVGSDKWQDSLQAIAQVLGRTHQAKKIIAAHHQQIEATRQVLAPVVKAYPKVLMVSSEQLNSSINLVTSLDFCGALLEDIGFKLATVSQSKPTNITQPISVEILPQLDADLIIVQGHNIVELSKIENTNSFAKIQLQSVQKSWNTNSLAQSLTASIKNRVYFIPTYICLGLPSPSGTQITLKSLQEQLLPLAKTVNQN